MQKKLLHKILAIGALMLLLGIPLLIIQSTIAERMRFRDQAVRSIADDSVREQTVIGPVLVLPYAEEIDSTDKQGEPRAAPVVVQRRKLVFPNELTVIGRIEAERRYRGIHQVLVYRGRHAMKGDFIWPQAGELPRERASSRIVMGAPFLALSVADVRGILDIPSGNLGGRKLEFEQGSQLRSAPSGVHAALEAADVQPGKRVEFSFNLNLSGIERQHFVPVGRNNTVTLTSNWPHPQFGGRFLPEKRSVTDSGFEAQWRVSALATGAQSQLIALEAGGGAARPAGELDSFNAGFIEPVNAYSQADRATKYGLLFVALTFAAFFVFEVVRRLPIHPIQYLLVGLALALFFLLLVGLSEHIDFLVSYLVASAACIVLIGYYLSAVLRDWRRGAGFGAGLTLLYAALYGLLISENNALVLGSVLLFVVLAALMTATRKLDWYELNSVS